MMSRTVHLGPQNATSIVVVVVNRHGFALLPIDRCLETSPTSNMKRSRYTSHTHTQLPNSLTGVIPVVTDDQTRSYRVLTRLDGDVSSRFFLISLREVFFEFIRNAQPWFIIRKIVRSNEKLLRHPRHFSVHYGRDSMAASLLNYGLGVPNEQAVPHYRVVTVEKPPFVMYDSEKLEWQGYCLDLMTYLSGMLNFTYDIEATPDGQFGIMDDNGTWDGMIRELQDDRADIALSALSIMSERENVVDFTMPFYEAVGITMMMRRREFKKTFFLFAKSLTVKMWTIIFLFYTASFLLLWLYNRWSPFSYRNTRHENEDENKKCIFNLKQSMWFIMSSITPQGCGGEPGNYSGGLVILSWWLFAFIILTVYTVCLAAHLTFSRIITPLDSFEDFTRQNRYKFATIKPSVAHTYYERRSYIENRLLVDWIRVCMNNSLSQMEEAAFDIYESPIRNINSLLLKVMNEMGHPADWEEALDRVNTKRFAVIGDATDIKYITRTHCDFIMVGEEFSKRPYGIAVQKGSPLKKQMDEAILQLIKDGILEKLKHRWWNEKIKMPKCPRVYEIIDGMTIGDMGGIFVIIVVGVCSAIGTLIFEFWWFCCWLPWKQSRRNKKETNDRSKKSKILRFTVKSVERVADESPPQSPQRENNEKR
ncbi:ionotropic receptor 25a-like [Venturia canescens]|uniref:ionotropic receptor 25a-like n=1 Tax=Venturia canescens TaxID=32260 RepID=UPI001C9CF327|nr:ionotropic receptor 25a-like [Venturia canescens]